jgi:cell division protein FtsW (lipid II flippase)
MPVTRSSAANRPTSGRGTDRAPTWRIRELLWMLAAGMVVAAALWLAWRAKTAGFAEAEQALAAKQIVNLNALSAREDLLPVLTLFPDPVEREFVARKIYIIGGGLANVGTIARIRVTREEIAGRGLQTLRDRLKDRESMPLVSGEQLRLLKPSLIVRRPQDFRRSFEIWIAVFFAAFLLVNAVWSLRGFRGDRTLVPALVLLCGVGLVLMISLRDPLRDQLLFADFAQGAALGCVLMAAAALLDFERLTGGLSFVPLLASFALSALLIVFGSGPGVSDAKVNLLGFQPVEIIRVLLVFFLAGYFAQRWDVLRHARETRASLARLTRHIDVPPVEHTIPAAACVALSLLFFFLQKDMGPALVFCCLFLVLYGIARASVFVPVIGLALVVLGFVAGFYLGVPHTVGERVSMWLSPWDNLIHGGDQLAQSLWAFSTGEASGMGIGLGDPQLVPAAHTDLILSALGEECGFLGVAAVFGIYAFLVWRALRIALRAASDYEFFLAAGLGVATALQLLLISAGALGVAPLSGVVTPFLSYGRTALLANFLVVGILESISARSRPEARGGNNDSAPFRAPVAVAGIILAIAGATVLAKAAWVELLHPAAVMGAGTLVVEADGARRFEYNPRFLEVSLRIPKGAIYDRNGLPLASSDWSELEKHRTEYSALGIDIDRACSRTDNRHYPFGGLMFDLLGDLRTRTRWAAGNTAFVERDSARRLRGYDDRPTLVDVKNPKTGVHERVIRYDYRELVPLVRHRYDLNNPEVRRVLDRPRDIHLSIDARLTVRVAAILRAALEHAGLQKGAAVILDPSSGDLLAAVSLPLPPDHPPTETAADAANPFLDRARFGLYPPGSTFKVVTAMAALRKDPSLVDKTYECIRLADGRVGNFIKGSKRPIRDDVQDQAPHGTVNMERGIVVSCNAYFAQLGAYDVGAEPLLETAGLLGISVAAPATAAQLRKALPQSSYGQGQVVASPFQMARVAATVATGGAMPQGRWITDETNTRTAPPQTVLTADAAATLGKFMREVVTGGTGRRAEASVPIAGKTGTAELASAPSHAWFIGFAPYGAGPRKIAFSILVENGVYGGAVAAPAAAQIVEAALQLGLIQP